MNDSDEAYINELLSISLQYLSNALFSYIKALLLIPIIICEFTFLLFLIIFFWINNFFSNI